MEAPPEHGDFVRMLAAMLMDGARVGHSEYKYGLFVAAVCIRESSRLAIIRALRPSAEAGTSVSPVGNPEAAVTGRKSPTRT